MMKQLITAILVMYGCADPYYVTDPPDHVQAAWDYVIELEGLGCDQPLKVIMDVKEDNPAQFAGPWNWCAMGGPACTAESWDIADPYERVLWRAENFGCWYGACIYGYYGSGPTVFISPYLDEATQAHTAIQEAYRHLSFCAGLTFDLGRVGDAQRGWGDGGGDD